MDSRSGVLTVVLLLVAYAAFRCDGFPGMTNQKQTTSNNNNTASMGPKNGDAAKTTPNTADPAAKKTEGGNALADAMQKCNESNPIPIEYLNELNTTGSFPDETDKGPMCYMQCYLQTVGILKEDNTVDKDRAASMLWPNSLDAIDDCMNEQDGLFDKDANGPCENAYYLTRCVMIKELLASRVGDVV